MISVSSEMCRIHSSRRCFPKFARKLTPAFSKSTSRKRVTSTNLLNQWLQMSPGIKPDVVRNTSPPRWAPLLLPTPLFFADTGTACHLDGPPHQGRCESPSLRFPSLPGTRWLTPAQRLRRSIMAYPGRHRRPSLRGWRFTDAFALGTISPLSCNANRASSMPFSNNESSDSREYRAARRLTSVSSSGVDFKNPNFALRRRSHGRERYPSRRPRRRERRSHRSARLQRRPSRRRCGRRSLCPFRLCPRTCRSARLLATH